MVTFKKGALRDLRGCFDRESILTEATKIYWTIRLDKKIDKWPPDLSIPQTFFDSIPKTVFDFLESFLKDPSLWTSDRLKHLIISYSCDMVHGVTLGKVMTLKRYLLGIGFYNISGDKLLVRILSFLRRAVSYDAETAFTEVSQIQTESGISSGLQPETGDDYVCTYFRADNFDEKIERKKIGMIASTHMIKC